MKTDSGVRYIDTHERHSALIASAVADIYNGVLDVVIVRKAFPADIMSSIARNLDRPDAEKTWFRPNAVIPTEDIYILGTDTPATPTCKAPRGASLENYLESASQYAGTAAKAVGTALAVEQELVSLLGELSGNRKVGIVRSPDGRSYAPYTLRLLKEGKQISVHHDYHYPLALYRDLSQILDTKTLVSFFLTLQRPEQGGGLIVYALNSDDPQQPQLPNGWWDVRAMEERYGQMRFDLFPGDFVLLASGRRFHRVEMVAGKTSRITLGGFLAFDKTREQVLFWS